MIFFLTPYICNHSFYPNFSKLISNTKSLYVLKPTKEKKLYSLKVSDNNKELQEENSSIPKKNNIWSFIKEVAEETRMIEWPSLERLFKQFVIVVISLVLSAFLIYSVDGFFASLSQFLFEGKI
mmetsp:Transcript_35429/g.70899  ORF Transcript_35429/g.70899 Transcript_35429/m.70899 type:complete len:124 (+) Transcript_35429:4049-4420(+)